MLTLNRVTGAAGLAAPLGLDHHASSTNHAWFGFMDKQNAFALHQLLCCLPRSAKSYTASY